MQKKEIFVGVDVSKETLDIAVYGSKNHLRISNNSEGFKQMQAWFKSLEIGLHECWFVMEFTGGYEYRLVSFCAAKQITFSRIGGLEIKKSLGLQRGKNDKIDSRRIATYGYEKKEKLKESKATSPLILRLKLLLTQRSAFVESRKGNEHRMKELIAMMDLKTTDELIKHYQQAIDFDKKMITKTEKALHACIQKDGTLRRNFELITSIPGIGNVNGWMTIAYTENFERFTDGRKYGAFCGVVPYEHSSGKSIRGKTRVSQLANKPIKSDLSMAAKAAAMHDPEMKQYYQRRAALGKKHVGIMNEIKFKLILRMFAVVNKGDLYVKKMPAAA